MRCWWLLLLLGVLSPPVVRAFLGPRPSTRHRPRTVVMGNLLSSGPSLDAFLAGKTVWITGASSGLGKALALECSKRGAKVVLSARSVDKLEAVKAECLAAGAPQVLVKPLDMAQYDGASFAAAAADVARTLGLDLLVNNAGVSTRSSAAETTVAVDVSVMATNFFGPMALTKVCLPLLRQAPSKAGHIVVINSVQGKMGLGMRTSYSASKHALTGYFDSLRAELSADKIPVTAIFPGYIRTELSLNALTGDGKLYAKMDETTAKGLEPTDLALRILKATAAQKQEVIFAPLDARAAIFLRNVLPGLVFKILGSKARKALGNGKKED